MEVMKRILIPSIGFVKVKCEASDDKNQFPPICRPSELPFYVEKKNIVEVDIDELNTTPSIFEQKTTEVRQALSSSVNTMTGYFHEVTNKVNFDQAKEWTAYLREEDNLAPRTGAIALGGLTGLIFGLRGGKFRKILYTMLGTSGMAAVCYPKEAAIYTHTVTDSSKHYLAIAYNFIYGVKPGDPQKELPSLPTIPTSFSEFRTLTSDITRSAKNMILGDKSDTSGKVSDIETYMKNCEKSPAYFKNVNTRIPVENRNEFLNKIGNFTEHSSFKASNNSKQKTE